MIKLRGDMVLSRIPNQIYTEIDEEIVMLSIENEEYYSLNEVGSTIWKLLESPLNVDSLLKLLLVEYDVEHEQCQDDTEYFINELFDIGIIEIQDAESQKVIRSVI